MDPSSPASSVAGSDAEIDLQGISIKGANNIFLKKKLTLQPELFLKRPDGRFKAYTKACPSQYARQPVILTGDEKAYIDKHDGESKTKSYDEHITYGTGDTKYHYICPRFWCLADEDNKQRSISFKEINDGKCGGWDALIPTGASKVPKGKRIYQFTDTRFHREKTKTNNLLVYKPMYPGYFPTHKHPKNLCIPCCFGKPTTDENTDKELPNMYKPITPGGVENPEGIGPTFKRNASDNSVEIDTIKGEPQMGEKAAVSRKERFSACNQSKDEIKKLSKKAQKGQKNLSPLLDTFPLNPQQLGYLPLSVQKFFGYDCKKLCQESSNNKNLKLNTPCLLHKGVEKSENQSFLSCIADAYQYHNNGGNITDVKIQSLPTKSISEIKKTIVENLTLDIFITLQNGVLIELFNKNTAENTEKYKDTKLYDNLSADISKDKKFERYFNNVVNAFENFIAYINADDVVIDYEYLWDFITAEGGLFGDGINLIIIKSPNDDITDKIELICPSNHYSTHSFDDKKDILILYNKGKYFEPIYKYTRKPKDLYDIKKLFSLSTISKTMPELEGILRIMWKNLTTQCSPLPSMPVKYNKDMDFKQNIPATKIIEMIEDSDTGYNVKRQIINFETKVIGVLLSKGAENIYIPCLPSSINADILYTYVHNPNMRESLKNTLSRLRFINEKTKIPCKPKMKIVDNNIVIGVITETNQMVPVIPEQYDEAVSSLDRDGVEPVHINSEMSEPLNYLQQDEDTLVNNAVDEERIKTVREIKLESNFYNVFRNLLRILLIRYQNKGHKSRILNIIDDITMAYEAKLEGIMAILKELMSGDIEFADYHIKSLHDINNITQCLGLGIDKCNSSEVCSLSTNEEKCVLQIPKKNLINGSDNEKIYYKKLSDELIRYERIQTYIFKPKTFLSFQEIPYDLRSNEIILLEELLYGDYFEDLIPEHPNPYITSKNVYDIVNPNKSQSYQMIYNLDTAVQPKKTSDCIDESASSDLILGWWQTGSRKRDADRMKRDGGTKWKDEVPILPDSSLIKYKRTIPCTWEIMLRIIRDHVGTDVTLSDLCTALIKRYEEMFAREAENKGVILKILTQEGKKDQVESIIKGTSLEQIITPDNYYLSLLDIFILTEIYTMSCIILCRTNIPHWFRPKKTSFNKVSFIQHDAKSYYLILGLFAKDRKRTIDIPNYGLIKMGDSIRWGAFEIEKANKLARKSLGLHKTELTEPNITSFKEFMKIKYGPAQGAFVKHSASYNDKRLEISKKK